MEEFTIDGVVEMLWVNIWQRAGMLDFAADAASGAIWMIISLTIRAALILIGVIKFIPEGFLFSFPLLLLYMIQKKSAFSFIESHFPFLPVRIAEAFMGRTKRNKLYKVLLANILGCAFGMAFFTLMFGWTSNEPEKYLLPIRSSAFGENNLYTYTQTNKCVADTIGSDASGKSGSCQRANDVSQNAYLHLVTETGPLRLVYSVLIDTIASFLFCVIFLVLPELLYLNRVSVHYMYIPIAVVIALHSILIGKDSFSAGFNPVGGLTLWSMHFSSAAGTSSAAGALAAKMESFFQLMPEALQLDIFRSFSLLCVDVFNFMHTYMLRSTVFAEHFVGSTLGGALAGLFCNRFTPDDLATWKRRTAGLTS